MKHTGESTEGLRKVNDLIRLISIILLITHVYYYCYGWFKAQGLHHTISNQLLIKLSYTNLFSNLYYTKGLVFMMIIISSIGMGVKKRKKLNLFTDISLFLIGTLIFFGSTVILNINELNGEEKLYVYSATLAISYLLIMAYASRLPRHMMIPGMDDDPFNEEGESFPQETELKENDYSINYNFKFRYKKKIRRGFINVVNPFRAMLVLGVQGSGKTYSIINEAIRQLIKKGFVMSIYDFKYPDNTLLAYNTLLKNTNKFKKKPGFYVINFDNVNYSNRCNPIMPGMLNDFSDAVESAKGILLNLNKNWIQKQGDFFVESPVNYLAASIWYLKKYQNGKFCTLPHVIELLASSEKDVIPLLASEPDLDTIMSPFFSAQENNSLEQLQGMIDSVRIPMTRLSSYNVYYVMSGNDFTLDINNPEEPKFVCFGNNDSKKDIYGALLGLYFQRMLSLINQKGKNPMAAFFDELPTVYVRGLDNLMATGRSNKIATVLGFQDFPQLERDYGQKVAEAMFSIVGNIFCGQVFFNTAEKVSKLFGKNRQRKVSITQNDDTTSYNTSNAMDVMIPASKLATQTEGEMSGIVADSIKQSSKFKIFKGAIIHDNEKISKEEKMYKPLPKKVDAEITQEMLEDNFFRIKSDIKKLIENETKRMEDLAREND